MLRRKTVYAKIIPKTIVHIYGNSLDVHIYGNSLEKNTEFFSCLGKDLATNTCKYERLECPSQINIKLTFEKFSFE